MKKIPNRKIILFLMAITISFGAFAQNEAVTEKYLVRANDNYNIKMYKDAYDDVNKALKINSAKHPLPDNVLLIAEPIYFAYLENIEKNNDYLALEEIQDKLLRYPEVESDRIYKKIKSIIHKNDSERYVKLAYNNRAFPMTSGDESIWALASSGIQSTSKASNKNIFQVSYIFCTLLFVVFAAVIYFLFIGIRILKLQQQQFASIIRFVGGTTIKNAGVRSLGGVSDVYGFVNSKVLLPPPRELAVQCEKLGEEIDNMTHRKNNSKNVSELVYKLAFHMGIPSEEAMIYFCAAMVYDAGFLGLSKDLLIKQSLTGAEKDVLRDHVNKADKYLRFVPKDLKQTFRDATLFHHENVDGSGYPFGLKNEKIPMVARLIHLCESYYSIISVRDYHEIRDRKSAIEELESKAGIIYDAELVAGLKEIL